MFEDFLLKYPSTSRLEHTCKKCGYHYAINNQTPFGIDQLTDFFLTEMRAMEAKLALVIVACAPENAISVTSSRPKEENL